MIRLNKWQRLGIVASVVWILGAGFYTLITEGDKNAAWNASVTLACEEANAMRSSPACDYFIKDPAHLHQQLQEEKTEAAIAAFVPVPFAWGFVYLVLFLNGWVKRGDQTKKGRCVDAPLG